LSYLLVDEVTDCRPDCEVTLTENVVSSMEYYPVDQTVQDYLDSNLTASKVEADLAEKGPPQPDFQKLN
jgi:hypothetical protein